MSPDKTPENNDVRFDYSYLKIGSSKDVDEHASNISSEDKDKKVLALLRASVANAIQKGICTQSSYFSYALSLKLTLDDSLKEKNIFSPYHPRVFDREHSTVSLHDFFCCYRIKSVSSMHLSVDGIFDFEAIRTRARNTSEYDAILLIDFSKNRERILNIMIRNINSIDTL